MNELLRQEQQDRWSSFVSGFMRPDHRMFRLTRVGRP
jgi:hypothetical protein